MDVVGEIFLIEFVSVVIPMRIAEVCFILLVPRKTATRYAIATSVGGRIILPLKRAYASNSLRQSYGFLADFGDQHRKWF